MIKLFPDDDSAYIVHSERNYEGYQPGTIDRIRGPKQPHEFAPELFDKTRTDFYEMEDIARELNRLRSLIATAARECEFDKLPRESFRQAMIDLYCEIHPEARKELQAEWPTDV